MRVLYVDIDSLRPDHLGCYGYPRPTSPAIDRLAAEGTVCTHYYASDTPCVPSRAACFSGRPGIRNGVVAHENTPGGAEMRYGNRERGGFAPLWMHYLVHHGVRTVGFTSFANRHLAGWFALGFREFHLSSLRNGHEDAAEVNETALPWFERHARDDRWFVHLNYWDPHTFYTEPREYAGAMAAAHPAPAWPDAETIAAQQCLTGYRSAGAIWHPTELGEGGRSRFPNMPDALRDRADFEHLIDGYDGAIRFADDHLRRVLDVLERQGVLDDTLVILSADHGEAFGEMGQYMEHGSAAPAVQRVPLVARWPAGDVAAGAVRDDLLLNTDLAPTVCEAMGVPAGEVTPPGWTGRSFLARLRGEAGGPRTPPRDTLVWSHGLHTRQRAVFADRRWLYLRPYEPSYFEYPPHLLFDVAADPHLTEDLSEREPGRAGRMAAALHAWEAEQVAATGLPDPLRAVQPYPPGMPGRIGRHLADLRARGREADARRLEALRRRVEAPDGGYAPPPLPLPENATA